MTRFLANNLLRFQNSLYPPINQEAESNQKRRDRYLDVLSPDK